MKVAVKLLIIFLITVFCAPASQAQTSTNDMIRRRAAQKVAQMNDYISFMASKKKSLQNRKYYSNKALNLFIGKGSAYEENGVKKDGVKMEVSSLKNSTFNRLIKTYFNNLINLGYSDVEITSTEIADIKVSNLQKVADNMYVCTCQYDQAFIGYKDGIPAYKDITTKRVKCYITAEETEDGTEYIIMLGDITALETKPYPSN